MIGNIDRRYYAVQKDCLLLSNYSWKDYPQTFLSGNTQLAAIAPLIYGHGEQAEIKVYDLQNGQIILQSTFEGVLSAFSVINCDLFVGLFEHRDRYILRTLSIAGDQFRFRNQYTIMKDYLTKAFSIFTFACVDLLCLTIKDAFSTIIWFFDYDLNLILMETVVQIVDKVHKLNDNGKIHFISNSKTGANNNQIQISTIDGHKKESCIFLLPPDLEWCSIECLWEFAPNEFYIKGFTLFPNATHIVKSLKFNPDNLTLEMSEFHEDIREALCSNPEHIYKINNAGNYLLIVRRPQAYNSTKEEITLVDFSLGQVLVRDLEMNLIQKQYNTHYHSTLCNHGILTTRTTISGAREYHVETILFDGSRKYKLIHLLKQSKQFRLDSYEIETVLEAINHNS